MPDTYLFHEYLEEVNQPLYFHQFAERAAAHGLQYIWESVQGDLAGYLRGEAKETLDRLSTDVIRREQNIDFLINRRFRRSLLCHDDVALDRSLPVERLMSRFWFVGVARPESSRVDLGSRRRGDLPRAEAESITARHPVVQGGARLPARDEPPAPLLRRALRRRPGTTGGARRTSSRSPTTNSAARSPPCCGHCVWPRLVATPGPPDDHQYRVGERPVASPVARYQAKSSRPRDEPSARDRSRSIRSDRHILPLLDGRRDRAALLDILVGMAETEQIPIDARRSPRPGQATLRSVLGELIDASLKRLASGGLIER